MTVKELIEKNLDNEDIDEIEICLVREKEKMWEGGLLEIPEEYHDFVVENISQHLSEMQEGILKFYVDVECFSN